MVAPVTTGAMLLLTLGASIGVLGWYQNKSEFAHKQVLAALMKVAAVQTQLGEVHTRLYRTITIISSLDDKAVKAEREQLSGRLGVVSTDAVKIADAATDDDALQKDLRSFVGQVAKYQKSADSAIDMSTVDANTGVAAVQSADTDFKALSATLASVLTDVDKRASETTRQLESVARMAGWVLAAAGLLAALGALAFSWLTQRRMVASIHGAAQAAALVAQGRLDVQPHSDDKDEVGDLTRALGGMVRQLRESMQTVRDATESIGTASTEIAIGNQDLSSRTEHTASNLQQAASSMEQLTGTVKQSADSARQANQLANSAAEVAARGGVVVSQVVATMDDINSSSKKISDIIGVIDGIAFQTNILALNAAVEAARAGEQGRGFAVVASEVRSLAARSAQAAKEIKSLIGASVEKVEGGSRLVADAGKTMTEIVSSVQRVSDIIGEITAASSEQSDGIGQINGSVAQLDQMTQQNAALVEQSAAAAESLKDQATKLSNVVATFQLGDPMSGHGAPRAAPAPAAAKPVAARAPTVARAATPPKAVAPKPATPAATSPAAADAWETF